MVVVVSLTHRERYDWTGHEMCDFILFIYYQGHLIKSAMHYNMLILDSTKKKSFRVAAYCNKGVSLHHETVEPGIQFVKQYQTSDSKFGSI